MKHSVKKLFSLILSVAMFCSAFITNAADMTGEPADPTISPSVTDSPAPSEPTDTPPGYIIGDVNLDAEITSLDALHILHYETAVINKFPVDNILAADVNLDGKINALDALDIFRYEVGVLDSFTRKSVYDEVKELEVIDTGTTSKPEISMTLEKVNENEGLVTVGYSGCTEPDIVRAIGLQIALPDNIDIDVSSLEKNDRISVINYDSSSRTIKLAGVDAIDNLLDSESGELCSFRIKAPEITEETVKDIYVEDVYMSILGDKGGYSGTVYSIGSENYPIIIAEPTFVGVIYPSPTPAPDYTIKASMDAAKISDDCMEVTVSCDTLGIPDTKLICALDIHIPISEILEFVPGSLKGVNTDILTGYSEYRKEIMIAASNPKGSIITEKKQELAKFQVKFKDGADEETLEFAKFNISALINGSSSDKITYSIEEGNVYAPPVTISKTSTPTEPTAEPHSGKCGDNLSWVLENGTMTISGTGDMTAYSFGKQPWHEYKDEITSLVIEDGVSSVAENSFMECSNMTSADISDSVVSIGNSAFSLCSLKEITLSENLADIGDFAFASCNELKTVTILNDNVKIGKDVFDEAAAGLVIKAFNGSAAQKYAEENEITFSSLDDEPDAIIPKEIDDVPVCGDFAEDINVGFSVSEEGKAVLNLQTNEQINAEKINLYVAYFDKRGRITGVKIFTSDNGIYNFNIKDGSYKIMMWDDAKPIINPIMQ